MISIHSQRKVEAVEAISSKLDQCLFLFLSIGRKSLPIFSKRAGVKLWHALIDAQVVPSFDV